MWIVSKLYLWVGCCDMAKLEDMVRANLSKWVHLACFSQYDRELSTSAHLLYTYILQSFNLSRTAFAHSGAWAKYQLHIMELCPRYFFSSLTSQTCQFVCLNSFWSQTGWNITTNFAYLDLVCHSHHLQSSTRGDHLVTDTECGLDHRIPATNWCYTTTHTGTIHR